MFRETVAVYSVSHTKPINTIWGQNAEVLNVKSGGTCKLPLCYMELSLCMAIPFYVWFKKHQILSSVRLSVAFYFISDGFEYFTLQAEILCLNSCPKQWVKLLFYVIWCLIDGPVGFRSPVGAGKFIFFTARGHPASYPVCTRYLLCPWSVRFIKITVFRVRDLHMSCAPVWQRAGTFVKCLVIWSENA
jgi:hypothetical protein